MSRVVVRSATLAAAVPWVLDVFCPGTDERSGELTTERAESSHGLPVVVVAGVAYGPADLGAHEVQCFADADRADARRAGYTLAEVQS